MSSKMVLSEGWKIYRFDQLAESINERVLPADANGLPYIGLEHLDSESLKIRRWGSPDEVEAQKLRFYTGDIIFGKRRYYQKKLAVADFDGICSAHAMVLRAKADIVLPEFLPFFMQSEMFFERAMSISVGSLSPTINWTALARQEFPLPPLDEQHRIAEILWANVKVMYAWEEVLHTLFKLRRSKLDHLFPEVGFEQENSSIVKLQDICRLQEGRGFPSSDYSNEGIRLLRPGNLGEDGYLIWTQDNTRSLPSSYEKSAAEYVLSPGDIVINLTAQSLEDGFMGRVCLLNQGDKSLLNQRLGRFICESVILPEFLFRYLQSSSFRKWADRRNQGSKIKHMYWSNLRNYPLLLPSLSEQHLAIQIMRDIDSQIQQTKEYIRSVRSMHLLLGGKLLNVQ
jgi:restriction endonuclease S subunit